MRLLHRQGEARIVAEETNCVEESFRLMIEALDITFTNWSTLQ
jgi:hypothetical protein